MKIKNSIKETLTDKAFSRLALTSVLAILICMACLCSTTYAWFTNNTQSVGNEIKSSNVGDFSVEVTAPDGTELTGIENGVELVADEIYTVTLSLSGGNASGYCLISAGGENYYSDYILRHESVRKTISFHLTVKTTQTVVFTPRWGIYTGDSDVVNARLIIP